MGVTRFESVIAASTVGTADVDKLAASFDKLSGSIDTANAKSKNLSEHPGFDSFASKIKQGLSDPFGAAGSAAESFLRTLGPVGTGVAAAAGIFTAAGVAAFDFARSLGEYGTNIQNVAIRTGLTTKEVGQFSFAAKLAGQDVSVFEGAMRKLSEGLSDSTEAGKKSRQGLADLGVKARDVYGQALPMSEVFLQISRGLNAIEDPAKRDAEAVRIFGRAGVELLPTMLGLNASFREAKELGFGSDQAAIDRMKAYQHEVVIIDTLFARLKRTVEQPFAATITVGLKWLLNGDQPTITLGRIGSALGPLFGVPGSGGISSAAALGAAGGSALNPQETPDDYVFNQGGTEYFKGSSISRSNRRSLQASIKDQIAQSDAAVEAALLGTDQDQLARAKQKLAEDIGRLKKGVVPEVNAAALTDIATDRAKVTAIEAQIKATNDLKTAKERLLSIEKTSDEAYSKAFFGDIANNPRAKYDAALAKIATDRAAELTKAPGLSGEINATFDKRTNAAALTFIDDTAKALRELNEEIATGIELGEKLAGHALDKNKEALRDYERSGISDLPRIGKPTPDPGYISPEEKLRDARDSGRRSLGLFSAQAQLSGASEGQQIFGLEAARQAAADAEYKAAVKVAEKKNDEVAKQDAADQKHQAYLDAEIERQQALLQYSIKQKEGFQNLTVGLVEALQSRNTSQFFTGIAHQLEDKIVGNLAGLAFGDVSKLIPHANGGILGKVLQGTPFGPDPNASATSANTLATIDNTNALRAMALSRTGGGGGLFTGGGGILGLGSLGGGGGYSGIGTGYSADGVPKYSPENYDANGVFVGPSGGSDPSAVGRQSGYSSGDSDMSPFARDLGIGAAAIGGGLGIYSGVKTGGARGASIAAGSAIGSAGAILSLLGSTTLGPIGAIAGGLIASILPAIFGDPKAQRQKELEQEAQGRSFTMPSGVDYSTDTRGRFVDSGFNGQPRSLIVNINTLDPINFRDYLVANPTAISDGFVNAVTSGNGNDMVTALSQRVNPN